MVPLTDSELHAAQLIARHMSAVIQRRGSASRHGPGWVPYDPTADPEPGSPLQPVEDDDAEGPSRPASQQLPWGKAAPPGGDQLEEPEASAASIGWQPGPAAAPWHARAAASMPARKKKGAGGAGEEQREWVLAKLKALIDALMDLEEAAHQERRGGESQGGCWAGGGGSCLSCGGRAGGSARGCECSCVLHGAWSAPA